MAGKLLEGAVPLWIAIGTGVVLLLFSAFCFVAGVWRHLFRVEAPEPEAPKLPSSILLVVNAFLAGHADFTIDVPADFPIPPDADGFLRCLPHRHGTDGFTAVRLLRCER